MAAEGPVRYLGRHSADNVQPDMRAGRSCCSTSLLFHGRRALCKRTTTHVARSSTLTPNLGSDWRIGRIGAARLAAEPRTSRSSLREGLSTLDKCPRHVRIRVVPNFRRASSFAGTLRDERSGSPPAARAPPESAPRGSRCEVPWSHAGRGQGVC